MTYEQVKNLKIADVIISSDIKNLVKECVGIIQESTLKDNEIIMLINAAVLDMERQNIDVEGHIQEGIIQGCIVMFVKANFGIMDIKEKELANKTYLQICTNLSLSDDYRKKGVDENV